MHRVYTAESLVEVAHVRNVLETAGIRCVLRNDRLAGVLGEIPFVECWPELWVETPGEERRARALIAEALRKGPAGPPWDCPGCGERIEPQFAVCWRCGAAALPSEAE